MRLRARFSALDLMQSPPSLWRRGWSRTDQGYLSILTPSSQGEPLDIIRDDEAPVLIRIPEISDPISDIEIAPNWHELPFVEPVESRSRQIGALGPLAWSRLTRAHVGIVGAGGLGSGLAEALAQDGVRRMTLVDPDSLEATDLSRWPAPIQVADFGYPKVKVLSNWLRSVNPEIETKTVALPLQHWTSFRHLIDCTFVVACCDSAVGRRFVAQLGARYLVPVISIGTGVFGTPEEPWIGFEGAVALPGDRCLACVMGLSDEAAQIADLQREYGHGRLGSLRSINLMAIGWAMRAIEDVLAGRLLNSVSTRFVYEDGEMRHAPIATQVTHDCFCRAYGAGDLGL